MYLLLAIGWHGGEELAQINASSVGRTTGFMVMGFVLNFVIGAIAYLLLNYMSRGCSVARLGVAFVRGTDTRYPRPNIWKGVVRHAEEE